MNRVCSEKTRSVLNKYLSQDPRLKDIYLTHVENVARKSLDIADRLMLSEEKKKFIYEAAFLHDVGIVKTDCPVIYCFGNEMYSRHTVEGYKILMNEGLAEYAGVALRHNVPLHEEYSHGNDTLLPENNPNTLEERIIAYSDLFYSKLPKIVNYERGIAEVLLRTSKYGPNTPTIIMNWAVEFGEIRLGEFEF